MQRTNIVLILILLIAFGLGMSLFLDEYKYYSITGNVIGDGFDIEKIDETISPSGAAFLNTDDDNMIKNVLDDVNNQDGSHALVKTTSIPGGIDDYYLYLDFEKEVVVLSIYMKKQGGDANFELWGPKKIAEGSLSDEFEWYNFDVSFKDMSSDRYAFYNFGGEDSNIVIDYILAVPKPKSGLSKHVTGM
jgi:hypothetical protein|tara:strand:+ start:690 stop:1259 length:570 start_codon:yes stop_codon:yes gene_type:complete